MMYQLPTAEFLPALLEVIIKRVYLCWERNSKIEGIIALIYYSYSLDRNTAETGYVHIY